MRGGRGPRGGKEEQEETEIFISLFSPVGYGVIALGPTMWAPPSNEADHKQSQASIDRINLAADFSAAVIQGVDVGVGQPRDHVEELLSCERRRA